MTNLRYWWAPRISEDLECRYPGCQFYHHALSEKEYSFSILDIFFLFIYLYLFCVTHWFHVYLILLLSVTHFTVTCNHLFSLFLFLNLLFCYILKLYHFTEYRLCHASHPNHTESLVQSHRDCSNKHYIDLQLIAFYKYILKSQGWWYFPAHFLRVYRVCPWLNWVVSSVHLVTTKQALTKG